MGGGGNAGWTRFILPLPLPTRVLSRFTLLNHRADAVFRLLRNGTNVPGGEEALVVEGQSPVVRNAIAAQPSQGHLALDTQGRCALLVVFWWG